MSATNAAETAILSLYFKNTPHANIGDATGLPASAAAGSLYISLHTADPGEAGTQTTSESAYTNYARQAVARSAAGFTVTGDTVTNAGVITFPAGGATGSLVTHFGIGTALSGAGNLLFKGALTASLQVNSGITPSYAIGALSVSAD